MSQCTLFNKMKASYNYVNALQDMPSRPTPNLGFRSDPLVQLQMKIRSDNLVKAEKELKDLVAVCKKEEGK